jgi:hypothetical protein
MVGAVAVGEVVLELDELEPEWEVVVTVVEPLVLSVIPSPPSALILTGSARRLTMARIENDEVMLVGFMGNGI